MNPRTTQEFRLSHGGIKKPSADPRSAVERIEELQQAGIEQIVPVADDHMIGVGHIDELRLRGFEPSFMAQPALDRYIAEDIARWEDVARRAGLNLNEG